MRQGKRRTDEALRKKEYPVAGQQLRIGEVFGKFVLRTLDGKEIRKSTDRGGDFFQRLIAAPASRPFDLIQPECFRRGRVISPGFKFRHLFGPQGRSVRSRGQQKSNRSRWANQSRSVKP